MHSRHRTNLELDQLALLGPFALRLPMQALKMPRVQAPLVLVLVLRVLPLLPHLLVARLELQ